jgi:uncharacterized membrane protein
MKSATAGISILVLVFALPVAGLGASYTYSDIHPSGWLDSRAVCVNNAGDVVGYGRTADGERGFLLTSGGFIEILPPGASEARATWVNGFGDVAVTAVMAHNGLKRAFVYKGGRYFDPTPGWLYSTATSVGDDGAVTGAGEYGAYIAKDGVIEVLPGFTEALGANAGGVLIGEWDNIARMYLPGTGYFNLVPPGAISAKPQGINGSNLVAISSVQGGAARGAVYSGGFYVYMTPPGWSSSVATGINDAAQVVGYGDSAEGRRSFLRTGSAFEMVAFPGWASTEAVSLNSTGKVAGSGATGSGDVHAFVASPAAETSSGTSGASGGGGCGIVHGAGRDASEGTDAVSLLMFVTLLVWLVLRRRKARPIPDSEPRQ